MKLILSLFCLTSVIFLYAQPEYLNHPANIKHYNISLVLEEKHDTITVSEAITLNLEAPCDSFFLDLATISEGKGMTLSSQVKCNNTAVEVNHRNDRIWFYPESDWFDRENTIELNFRGVPKTGLIIGENKFGNRTYFGDNWPNRAHQWFACVDHPSDKATISYDVIVPAKYQCIATGEFANRTLLGNGQRIRFSYNSDIELPTKVMVIGVANFVVEKYETDLNFDVTAWVYPEDAQKGIDDMKVSVEVLEYFQETLGTYPFEKLANVQSTTQFGGMENAGNIFYDENAVQGGNSMEALIAHEIAHQWFGNSASEMDWPHLWLSEGFATYLTDLYWENKYGREAMNERLIAERNRVLQFAKRYQHPVVDTEYESLMDLLNPNSYQKGAWILHMLREKVGLEAFYTGLRAYMAKYSFGNATTDDFQSIMEGSTGEDLSQFFEQWLHRPLHPVLNINTSIQEKQKALEIKQVQKGDVFHFDLEVEVIYADKSKEIVVIPVEEKETRFVLPSEKEITGFRYDPNVKLLFEEVEY